MIILLSKKAHRLKPGIEKTIKEKLCMSCTFKTGITNLQSAVEDSVKELKSQCGLLILSKNYAGGFTRKRLLSSLINTAKCPVLLSAQTFPYNKIAVPVIADTDTQHLLEAGLEISLSLKSELNAILTEPSEYTATDDEIEDFNRIKKTGF